MNYCTNKLFSLSLMRQILGVCHIYCCVLYVLYYVWHKHSDWFSSSDERRHGLLSYHMQYNLSVIYADRTGI